MNQYSTEPEYTVETQLEKMHLFTHPLKDMESESMVQVVAELRLLSKELSISVDILGKIRDSVLVLQLSLQEQV